MPKSDGINHEANRMHFTKRRKHRLGADLIALATALGSWPQKGSCNYGMI